MSWATASEVHRAKDDRNAILGVFFMIGIPFYVENKFSFGK
jgi:hypothetical protein